MRRFVRKHRLVFFGGGLYLLIFFFPTLVMQRVVSPNDVFFNFDPWAAMRTGDVQNSLINDPPTSYYTQIALLKRDWSSFHWNRFIASGVPGFGSAASAVLSPFVLLPALLLPLPWVYSGIVLLKFLGALFFAYLWLREERLGKRSAAIGAILFAASGAISVRWLWQATNAAALYPALLWIALRTARGKRTPFWAVGMLALSYALAGFPATMAYGGWLAGAYFLFVWIRERRADGRTTAAVVTAVVLALLIAAPALVPFAQMVRRTGYLETRADSAFEHFFPLRHLRSLVMPDRLGNPAERNWVGDRDLGVLNNYVEATIFIGLVGAALALIGVLRRRARNRWFWLATTLMLLGCMFGAPLLPRLIGSLPGFKYSSLTRLQLLLPLPIAYLAGAGVGALTRTRFRNLIGLALMIAATAELGVFAGRFYPYLELQNATPPSTPMISFLRSQPGPFRIAPLFNYLWPNSSELVGLEDVRSHFSSEEVYRRLLKRVDPSSFDGHSTVLLFNSLKFQFDDPLVSMLGVRYFVEHKSIDIVKWTTFKNTVAGVKETGALELAAGRVLQRHIRVDAEPFYAIELPVSALKQKSSKAHLSVWLLRGSSVVYARDFLPADIAVMDKVYIPLRPFARLGETVILRIQPVGMSAGLLRGSAEEGDAPIFFGRVMTPVIFERELPDGRLFRNAAEVPRFHAVSRLRQMTLTQLLATPGVDFSDEAIVTDSHPISLQASDAQVSLRRYGGNGAIIDVSAPAATMLASSEKLTPELRVVVDGREVRPVQINGLFAGVPVPAGQHRVEFSRRIGRGWWIPASIALILFMVLSFLESMGARIRARRAVVPIES
ncbi:MAG: DUF6541 family protein [Thermoanaerobaculia bacterium]